jgi:hypothetical protein
MLSLHSIAAVGEQLIRHSTTTSFHPTTLIASMVTEALRTTSYHGMQQSWNLKMFVNLHRQQHSVLEGLVKHTYAGTDERSKVRHLLDGIKTNKVDVVRNQIIANADYRNNFDMCATFYF